MVHVRIGLITTSLTVAVAAAGVAGFARAAERTLIVAQATPVPAAAAVLASSEDLSNSDLRCDLLQMKRVSGGALLVRFRLTYTASQGSGLTATPAKDIVWAHQIPEFYFIDPAENKRYFILTDSEEHPIGNINYTTFKPGNKMEFWAKFPAPPATSTKISLTIAGFLPFDDIPVGR